MLHIIVYDIANERRLRRIAALCEDFGVRVEKSVFECELADAEHERFWRLLQDAVDETVDRVVDYPVDEGLRRRIRSLGAVERDAAKLAYVF